MGFMEFFTPVPTATADEAHHLLADGGREGYNLIDVRQPKEYADQHLPGAILIPLGELKDRLADIDPAKPTIVYCRSGVRSRSAAILLLAAGRTEVVSMAGGINAWEGEVASGPPEAGMIHFAPAVTVAELVVLARGLEEGTRRFYEAMAARNSDEPAALFAELVADEVRHKEGLEGVFHGLGGRAEDLAVIAESLGPAAAGGIMEGGMVVDEAIAWAADRTAVEVLEVAMALEVNAFDLYLKMARRVEEGAGREVFRRLALAEEEHLRRLAARLEQGL